MIQIDPIVDSIADGLTKLITRKQEMILGPAEEHAGLAQLLADTLSIRMFAWTAFLTEAESHLRGLVSFKLIITSADPNISRVSNASTELSSRNGSSISPVKCTVCYLSGYMFDDA